MPDTESKKAPSKRKKPKDAIFRTLELHHRVCTHRFGWDESKEDMKNIATVAVMKFPQTLLCITKKLLYNYKIIYSQ